MHANLYLYKNELYKIKGNMAICCRNFDNLRVALAVYIITQTLTFSSTFRASTIVTSLWNLFWKFTTRLSLSLSTPLSRPITSRQFNNVSSKIQASSREKKFVELVERAIVAKFADAQLTAKDPFVPSQQWSKGRRVYYKACRGTRYSRRSIAAAGYHAITRVKKALYRFSI